MTTKRLMGRSQRAGIFSDVPRYKDAPGFRETHRAIHAYCSPHWVCSHDAQLRLEILATYLG